MANTNTIRSINASVKKAFGEHSQFVPCKASYAGSFPAIRFEGDLPISLLDAIALHVEREFPDFAMMFGKPVRRSYSYHMCGSVINWVRC